MAHHAGMLPWDGRTAALPGHIDIKPLGPDRLDDFLRFFDYEGFRDNPFWAGCYCMEPHFTGSDEEWVRRTGEQNRADKIGLIRQDEAHGYLAYAGGRTVGWCHAAPPYRRQSVAGRLPQAAVDGFRARGLRVAEAYPPREIKGDPGGYHGTLSMYLAAGFSPYREGERYVIVRKALAAV